MEIRGLRARTADRGPEAPVLLLLHGLGGSGASFAEAFSAPELASCSLVAPDLPGFGGTPPIRPFTFEAVVGLLEAFARTLGRPLAVLGYSMSGPIAIRLAERVPVEALVLVEGTILPVEPDPRGEASRAGRFDEWLEAHVREIAEAAETSPMFARYLPQLTGCDRRTYEEASLELARAAMDAAARYARLDVPRVYVAGYSVDERYYDFLSAHGLEVERFPEAGHAVMVDDPGRFYAFLGRRLADVFGRVHA